MSDKDKVMVTGATGYIGMWVIKKALEQDKYHIVAVKRGLKEGASEEEKKKFKEKEDSFLNDVGGSRDTVTIRYADVQQSDQMTEAAKDCQYIIHLASPFPQTTPKDAEETVVKPAVEGAINAMEAAYKNGVKRIVLTSSIAAIMDHTRGDIKVDETSWPPNADDLTPYYRSKIRAEEEAIKYLEKLKEEEKFELIRLNPGVVIGPLLNKDGSASTKAFKDIMDGTMFSIPQLWFPLVDVRDVADAHLLALEKPVLDHKADSKEDKKEDKKEEKKDAKKDAKKEEEKKETKVKDTDTLTHPWTRRIAIIEGSHYFPTIGEDINSEYKEFGYGTTTGVMCGFTIWMASFFDTDASQYNNDWNVNCEIKNDRSKDILGMNYTEYNKSLKEMCDSFIKFKVVEDKRNNVNKDPNSEADEEDAKEIAKNS